MIKKTWDLLQTRINLPERLTVPWGWPLGLGLSFIWLVVSLLALVLVSSVTGFEPDEAEALVGASLIAHLIMGGLLLQYTGVALGGAKADISITEALGWRESINTPLPIVVLYGLFIAIMADVIGLLLGVSPQSSPIPLSSLEVGFTWPFIVAVLILLLLRPVVEETLFRGILYPALLKSLPPLGAIGLTALIFALLHFALDPQIWWGFVLPLILGLAAGVARAATKSTLAAIGLHGMFSLFVILRVLALG